MRRLEQIRNILSDKSKSNSDYQYCEYIETDGNSYILTDYVPHFNDIITYSYFAPVKEFSGAILGVRDYPNAAGNASKFMHIYYKNANLLVLDMSKGGGATGFNYFVPTTEKNTIIANFKDKKLIINGVEKTPAQIYKRVNIDIQLAIFALNERDTLVTFAQNGIKFYNLSVERDGEIICNYQPCYRKTNNEIGMIDTISGKFYTNNGTGTFTKGEDI